MNLRKIIYVIILIVSALLANTEILCSQSIVKFLSSNLPIIIINTPNNAAIVDDPKVNAHMGIISNLNGINNITDILNVYNGAIGIELRGNSTQTFPKKSYALEMRDEVGNDLDFSLLGMPADNDWILLASYFDRTFIRDPLAHYISESAGEWTSHSRHCELVLNGNYMGIYLLMEKIKWVKSRLNISKLSSTDISNENVTGGYIYEVTGFTTLKTIPGDFGLHRVIQYPKYDKITNEQLNYIEKYDTDFRNVMESANYEDFLNGYEKYINVNSFVNELIVQEVMRNSDAYGWSSYFHKDRNSKLNAGPVWDFDQASGNSSYNDGFKTTGWIFNTSPNFVPVFWKKLFNEPRFQYRVKLKWQELRSNKLTTENINAYIDSCATLLNEAHVRNFTQWPTLGIFIWRETVGFETRDTYEKEVAYLKTYMAERMAWIDGELDKVVAVPLTPPTPISENRLATFKLYPNPASDYLMIDTGEEINNILNIQIYNNKGILAQNVMLTSDGNSLLKFNLNSSLANGLYHLRVVTKVNKIYTGNFIIVK